MVRAARRGGAPGLSEQREHEQASRRPWETQHHPGRREASRTLGGTSQHRARPQPHHWQRQTTSGVFSPSSHFLNRIRGSEGRSQLGPEGPPHLGGGPSTDPAALTGSPQRSVRAHRTPLPQLCSPSQMWRVAAQRHAPHPATLPPAPAAAAGLPGERYAHSPSGPRLTWLCPTCPFISPPSLGPLLPR